MKKLNVEDLEFLIPSTPNKQMMISHHYYDGVDIQNRYFDNVKIYSNYLEVYLSDKLNLKEIEKALEESKLSFIPVEEDKDIYQEDSIFKYFYLRNYLHIEKLTEEETEILTKPLSMSEIISFVESTYKKVITIDCGGEYINYGPESINFLAKKTDIVLGFRYEEYIQPGNTEEEKLANYFEQVEFLNKVSNNIQKKAEENSIALKLIKYDSNSIYTKEDLPNQK